MPQIKVRNMESSNGSNVPNQFIIETNEGVYFQSYKSVIAFKPNSNYKPELDGLNKSDYRTQLDESKWDYSVTTGKYRNQFLGEDIKETRKNIKDKQYILTDLNN